MTADIITTKKGALFDLDGVLIDSETLYTQFWEKTGRDFGMTSPTFAYDIKGTTLKDILSTYFPEEVHPELIRIIHEFEDTMVYPVFDGVREFLDMLDSKGIRKAVVTSSDNTKMGYLFEQQPWMKDAFQVIITGSMVTNSKPDPEGYLLAAEKLGLSAKDCCVFEDSFQGLEAGRRSGATVIGLATTNSAESLKGKADYIIHSFKEIQ